VAILSIFCPSLIADSERILVTYIFRRNSGQYIVTGISNFT